MAQRYVRDPAALACSLDRSLSRAGRAVDRRASVAGVINLHLYDEIAAQCFGERVEVGQRVGGP